MDSKTQKNKIKFHCNEIIKLILNEKLNIKSEYEDNDLQEIFENTPNRMSNAIMEMMEGYDMKLEKEINNGIFDNPTHDLSNNNKEIIMIKDIDISSTCQHHFLPFFGKITIGYIPKNKIFGLSKFSRITNYYSKRMQTQENLIKQIADSIKNILDCYGVYIISKCEHTCMKSRGVKNMNSYTSVTYSNGLFVMDNNYETKFFNLLLY